MTIKDIIIKYSDKLKDISDTPRLDTELLLQKTLGVDRLYIHLNLNKELTEEQKTKFIGFAEERLNGRPIAYIVENREFMGLDFFVKEGVLIPRPDTETLVEEIIEICREKKDVSILDIGTGSGAITISLAKYIENSKIMSFDVSEIALEIAKKNAIINEVGEKIKYINSDLFTAISDSNIKFDIIVSNPPYIKKQDIETLHKQVKDYEPYNALEGGEDGLDFYRRITEQGKKYLNKRGILAYEVGHNQAEDVINIMKSNGYKKIYTKKDIQGIDRVVIGYNI
ncbi:TPA: peptide chain release factor N(5)-glutamine methyltransferase [Clostridioides difficile]|uniref:peptide chain release factor N(5)-glutamine methyltransferase n=1 Tax=Clostridioides difficile TaxID=1496 RepID=UPI00038D072E|nr:peptide chain release factor N(5)-glutamine methyltransferase [Clostridioides difficile]EQG73576.1 protein-(glutamine-N5) methyltransferase, release factor-specific [Clostridioides difficile DA00165]AXU51688.1 protein methyltransferase [Clostridioides difficile]AXU77282.1 protein methyltransferase [Clostridioides difficile]EAA0009514.1 peptide chain release factor N(5)-glutamine methyltransferase [Clostridioides difficile]EGT2198242.1 peptide chain release factor N(5)-glutamine methyltransf